MSLFALDSAGEGVRLAAYFLSVMNLVISIDESFHTCLRISFSSKKVDSQSFPSENGVILILSSLMSKSGLAAGELDEAPPIPPLLVGVLLDDMLSGSVLPH
jgi:hypothetical protein